MKIPARWDKVSYFLHMCFASTIVFQLLISLIMHRPYLNRVIPAYSGFAFQLHAYVGLLSTFIIALYWVWILCFRPQKLSRLFPWKKPDRLCLIKDIKLLSHFKLPKADIDGRSCLAGLIHGAGLLLVSCVGLLGVTLFFTLPNTKALPTSVYLIKETHEILAYWLWWYLAGHGGMALVHWISRAHAK